MNRIFLYIALLLAWQTGRAQGIKIMPGTTFKLINGSYNLVLSNGAHLENNAAMQAGDLVLKATGNAASEIKGSGSLAIRQLRVSKAAAQKIILQKDIDVSEGVFFNTGLLDLNGFDLILADTASLVGESETSRAMGNGGAIQITRDLDMPLAENPGNLGLIITSGASWGNTTIRRGHQTYANAGSGSVSRNFEVIPTNNTGLNAFLRMYYLGAELNGLTETALDFYESDNGGTSWTNIGATSRNAAQNFVNLNGVQEMSLLTLGTINAPLPLTLTGMDIACLHNRPVIQWRIAYSGPGDLFRIQKSLDGNSWQSIPGDIPAIAENDHEYSYTDITEPYPYYRLLCVRSNGETFFSKVLQANCQDGGYRFSLLQNPVDSYVPLSIQSTSALNTEIVIYDMAGKVLLQKQAIITPGVSRIDLDVSALASGMYLIQAKDKQGLLWQSKFVK
jgi:hypothetical protein